MVLGPYPQRLEGMSESRERLLDPESEEYEHYSKATLSLLHRQKGGRLYRFLPAFVALAGGVGMFIAGFGSGLFWKVQVQPECRETLGEINGLVPSVGTKSRLFVPDPNFDAFNASDPGWLDVMPVGGGFVPIEDWQGKILPDPIQTHGADVYNIAVFHQLHCLHMLAEEFDNLITGSMDRDMKGRSAQEMDGDLMMRHIGHCFEYLKDSLTCCADTALEGQKRDTDLSATDGFGASHMCRDIDAVFKWAQTNRASDQAGYPHGTA